MSESEFTEFKNFQNENRVQRIAEIIEFLKEGQTLTAPTITINVGANRCVRPFYRCIRLFR